MTAERTTATARPWLGKLPPEAREALRRSLAQAPDPDDATIARLATLLRTGASPPDSRKPPAPDERPSYGFTSRGTEITDGASVTSQTRIHALTAGRQANDVVPEDRGPRRAVR